MLKNCVILAGGKSSRMHQDKTLLKFGDSPTMTHFLHKNMSKIFERVFVSCKNDKFNGDFEILKDDFEIFSPIFAIGKVLQNFTGKVFIIAADMPCITKKTIEILNDFKADIVVPKSNDKIHWLCGFYKAKISKILIDLAQKNLHKMGNLQNLLNCKIVDFKSEEFANLNTQEDYKRALR